MSIGLNNMQSAWSRINPHSPWGSGTSSTSTSPAQLASLQMPGAISTNSNVPSAKEIQFPDWLKADANSGMGELLDTYSGIGAAFDPTAQIEARNNAIAYNTAAGGQAANNAATEYAARAQQSGGSALGAGVVKAQSLMPVLAQNASLKGQAADVAAKAHQDAASLASQIAGTISQLRTSYLGTLAGYAQGQQQLALDKYKAESAVSGQNQQAQLAWGQQQADIWKAQQAVQLQKQQQATQTAQAQLATPRPNGTYTTNNQGQVTSGMDYYNQLQQWQQSQSAARNSLGGML